MSQATLHTSAGAIVLELHDEDAPKTVENFRKLSADKFYADQLKPRLLEAACRFAGQPLELNLREGYDHGYFFIQSFISQHLTWHAKLL